MNGKMGSFRLNRGSSMDETFLPYPDEVKLAPLSRGIHIVIRQPFLSAFAVCFDHPNPYDCLTGERGRVVKRERRTVIRLWEVKGRYFFCKHYRYFGLSRMRTLGGIPKAHREYLTLGLLKRFKVPSVEAVGWGSRRNRWGGLWGCFILTVRQDDTLDFRAWLKQNEAGADFRPRTLGILRTLAGYFRTLHASGFFLLRPNTRNVLVVHPKATEPALCFLDQPYARFLKGRGALWGQLKDLSTLLGGVLRHMDEEAVDVFLKTYLPDPLGKSPRELKRRLRYALRARESDRRFAEWGNLCLALAPTAFGQKRGKRVG